MNTKFYVYKFTNNINSKVYIGVTNDIKRRVRTHKLCRGGNVRFHNAIKKYGFENFIFTILEECNSQEEAFITEITYIEYYKSNIEEFGYNLTSGGEGATGYKHTEDARNKISISKIGINNPMFGVTSPNKDKELSEEAKLKISQANTGKRHTEEHKQRISDLMSGPNNPMYNKKHSKETKEKISKANKGRKHSEETKKKMSESHTNLMSGIKHPNYGKCTSQEIRKKISNSIKGANHPRTILTEENVREIRTLLSNGTKINEVAKTFNVNRSVISAIKHNKTFKSII